VTQKEKTKNLFEDIDKTGDSQKNRVHKMTSNLELQELTNSLKSSITSENNDTEVN